MVLTLLGVFVLSFLFVSKISPEEQERQRKRDISVNMISWTTALEEKKQRVSPEEIAYIDRWTGARFAREDNPSYTGGPALVLRIGAYAGIELLKENDE